MASIISAGTTDATSLNISGDKTGILQLASNNATVAVTIDTLQNVGIGVTPAAFADKVVQVGSTGALAGSASYGSILSNNIYWSVAGFSTAKYITTGYGSYYYQDQTGKHTWASIPSGTAGTSATATNGMTLDNNNVLYLPNPPTGDAHVKIQQGAVTTLGSIGSSGLLILGGGSNNNLCQIGLGYTGSYSPTAISSITTTQSGYTIADLIFATRSVNTDTAPSTRMTIAGSGSIGAPSGTNIYNASDARLKKNIQPLTKGLDAVNALKPVSFNWIEDFCPVENDKTMYGFVAQDTKEVDENLVEGFNNGSDVVVGDLTVEKAMRVNEKFIIPMLTKAIQELKAINDTQAETINALTARIEALENN